MVKNIIFDLGNVLLNVHYERFREKIYSNNVTKDAYEKFFLDGDYRILGYEAGKISTDEFVSRCINGLSLSMSSDEFIDAFNDMFTEIAPMKKLLMDLADNKKFGLFLLSNTSPLHFDHAKKQFDFLNRLDKFGLSYELKSLKPEKEIYEKALKLFGVSPGECLFIDDLEDNCEAANRFGIQTIVYDKKDHNRFLDEYENLLGIKGSPIQ